MRLFAVAAKCKGVFPTSPTALGSAPAMSSFSTTSNIPWTSDAHKQAQCSAVSPNKFVSCTGTCTSSKLVATSTMRLRQAAIRAEVPSSGCLYDNSDRNIVCDSIHFITSHSCFAYMTTSTSCKVSGCRVDSAWTQKALSLPCQGKQTDIMISFSRNTFSYICLWIFWCRHGSRRHRLVATTLRLPKKLATKLIKKYFYDFK